MALCTPSGACRKRKRMSTSANITIITVLLLKMLKFDGSPLVLNAIKIFQATYNNCQCNRIDIRKFLPQARTNYFFRFLLHCANSCLQCFDAVGWAAAGRASGL